MTFHSHPKPYADVLETIGWTPLIRLSRIGAGLRTPIYGKAEYQNPGGSVKDRIGIAMIEAAERAGELRPGGTIVEGTSGNTGVGLAMAAALKGYRCVFTMPDKMSQEKVKLLRAYGAEVVITPTAVPPDHPDNYIMKAKQIVHDTPGAILANQHFNQINPEAHYATTGPEIWEQMEGRVDAWLAGAGTGGTFTGVARYLKERNPNCWCVVVEPQGSILKGGEAGPHEVEGIGASSFIPPVLDMSVADEVIQIEDAPAFAMVRRLAGEEGVLGASSAGANVAAALQVCEKLGPGKRVVTLIPDAAERYMSKGIYTKWAKPPAPDHAD